MYTLRIKLLIIIGLLLVASPGWGAVLYSDDFDDCTSNCAPTASSISPPNSSALWTAWYTNASATADGVTHWNSEITSPGRGGSGKSLKVWRHSIYWTGYSGINGNIATATNDMYFRYYIKIPVEMDITPAVDYLKWWRINVPGGIEQYIGMRAVNRSTAYVSLYNSAQGHTTVLTHTQTLSLWDGNWHCLEFHFNNTSTTGTAEVWMDGVATYSNSSYAYPGTGIMRQFQHFSVGNHGDGGNWQNSWQAIEFDDLVISTTYVGPDSSSTPTIRSGGFRSGGIR